LRFVAYPLVIASALGISWCASLAGWAPVIAVGTAVGVAGTLTFVLERIIPYQREWLKGHVDVRTDIGYARVSGPLVSALNGFLMVGVADLAARASARWGIALWQSTWPTACRLLLALVIAEFAGYWLHRFQHQNAFLWRLHAPHHSVHRLYFLNGLRQHPIDSLVTSALNMSLLVLVGAADASTDAS
jgi:sterol desaturase/sphingolipid hydroxylase (fatty acid hydroxylase superfamily)